MPIQTILVPTDFSELATEAVDFAFVMSKQMKLRMIFLYVDEWPDQSDTTAPLHNEYGAYKKEDAGALLSALVRRAKNLGLEGSTEVVDGVPFLEIIRTARKRNADLIVIGTHGRSGLPQTIIGSEAERIIRESTCPVLTVKSKDHKYAPV